MALIINCINVLKYIKLNLGGSEGSASGDGGWC